MAEEGFHELPYAGADVLAGLVEAFLRFSLRVPEVLFATGDEKPRGVFARYGGAPAPGGAEEATDRQFAPLDQGFRGGGVSG